MSLPNIRSQPENYSHENPTMNAYLILCHRAPTHILTLAQRHPTEQYYIHYDAKAPLIKLDSLKNQLNIHIVRNRIDVNWGGFSMIEATLVLIQAALANKNNRHFHLMSGDCVPLKTPEQLAQICQMQPENTVWLHSKNTPHLRYRTRFNAPHADTKWQRKLIGKILTRSLKIADKLIPSSETCLSGSQWFSANRAALQILFNESLGDPTAFFEKKLVPDEHFFQHIVAQNSGSLNHINDNHRFIRFAENANHPDALTLDDLWAAQRQDFWFARKVSPENIERFLQYETQL
ncbi:beta-1,6-N-acetylglucosaminyltransferase [Kingella negevensis]|uniref:beta-1,6-N-acetylglucosaminyltransferase n=1 Tax=Kingella negevensis TaxID=1522312 RepID=UPI00254F142E|nr:beta-1,6-N-acetylglucosaminyltransferase [Kingella negevensis]MDK4680979.1 beta-1,6-N-acetylglucosaminyltransferase [Kingella negevensis]MDK4683181.1 beta-1,6-N-acetylglucosaminyltransferase [Kingella negevensis]MDK4691687.1 beta-1,6-N-acetylglucosaminyltransferase [Kingella negevensis]MDK4693161.1 beta-1,6-N-acetylglucosaminyltransferase [Kingella negevensis]MDK4699462.1 beta-1,6-N-acetylglucosaminyltransferase [Kingella negevensis]